MNFVDRVLLLHDLPSLYKFSLTCHCIDDPSRINTWISTALKRNVQQLHLCILRSSPLPLPRSLFISDTLTYLEIVAPEPSPEVTLPTTVRFTNLKFLYLKFLYFRTYQSTTRLSLSFPMLQELMLGCCEWSMEYVEIVAPSLEKLVFHDYYTVSDGGNVNVFAENLQYLELVSQLTNWLSLGSLSSLAKASICLTEYHDAHHQYIVNTLRKIFQVNHLILSDFPIKFLSQAENLPLLLSFSSLIHLEVDPHLNTFFEDDLYRISSEQLIDILRHLPTVKYFQFNNCPWGCGLGVSRETSNEVVPKGCLSHLELVKLKHFHGSKNELLFVKELLNKATMLKEMIIISKPNLLEDLKKHRKIGQKLLMLPRKSKCVIRYS